MKKITLTLLSVIVTVSMVFAQNFSTSGLTPTKNKTSYFNKSVDATYFITHSQSQTIVSGNSVSCNSGGLHTDNSFWRVFDLVGDFGINEAIDISSVEVAIETAASSGGTQPISINIYTLSGPFVLANLSLIATKAVTVSDQTNSILSVPISAAIPSGSLLVVEVFTPDGQSSGNSFFIGSNNSGETAPSYISAASCGIVGPTTTADLGFPNMQIVLNVNADSAAALVPLNSWAIVISLLLISLFVVIRIRF
ncbi:MAG: hypothetical protein B7C24_07955 [Bacteroidetes bacterium 4572_77]|nr:MAG: hypothetical protein B7C24_07955 [Bacteroidetes bacterium 4572_77]